MLQIQKTHQHQQVRQVKNNQQLSLFHKTQLLARNSYYQILVQKHLTSVLLGALAAITGLGLFAKRRKRDDEE